MSEDYKIEKGIPVARQSMPKKPASALTKALRAMDVGDSIKANLAETRASLAATMRREGLAAGKKFVCRTIHATETEPKHYRVWRVK